MDELFALARALAALAVVIASLFALIDVLGRWRKSNRSLYRLGGALLGLGIGSVFGHAAWRPFKHAFLRGNEVTVAVARIESGGEDRLGITNIVLATLQDSLATDREVHILGDRTSITETEGRLFARRRARAIDADLYCWGWYVAVGDSGLAKIVIENVDSERSGILINAPSAAVSLPIGEFAEHRAPRRVGQHLAAATLCVAGFIRYKRGLYSEAARMLKRAIALGGFASDPRGEAVIRFYLAGAEGLTGDMQASIDELTRAIALDSTFIEALTNRGELYAEMSDWTAALRDYDYALRHGMDDELRAALLVNRAGVLGSQGALDKALRDASAAAVLRPRWDAAHYTRAVIFQSRGDSDSALNAIDLALRYGRRTRDALGLKGGLLLDVDRFWESEACASEALALRPERDDPRTRLISIHLKTALSVAEDEQLYRICAMAALGARDYRGALVRLSNIRNPIPIDRVVAASAKLGLGDAIGALKDCVVAEREGAGRSTLHKLRVFAYAKLMDRAAAMAEADTARQGGDSSLVWLVRTDWLSLAGKAPRVRMHRGLIGLEPFGD